MASRHGASKCEGRLWASSKIMTELAMLCNFLQVDGLLENRDSKNWTLVVTIKGASQFSDISLTLSVSLSAARLE